MTSSPPLRPVSVLLRTKDSVEIYNVPDTSSATVLARPRPPPPKRGGRTLYEGKTTFHLLHPNGECAYVHDADVGLVRCDVDGGGSGGGPAAKQPFLANSRSVQLAKCSPRGSYLVTWERPNSSPGGNDNLKVWDARSGSFVRGFACKKATLAGLQWTHDEGKAFHMVTNELHVYSGEGFERAGRVRCPGVASFSLPSVKGYPSNVAKGPEKEEKYLLTAFVPGQKGRPARVDLLRYPDRAGRESSSVGDGKATVPSGPSLASKSLFDAEEAVVRWSPRADSALVLTQTAVDATGESYYGSTHLFLLLENDPKRPGFGSAVGVEVPSEAAKTSQGTVPVVAAEWTTNPKVAGPVPFGIVAGRMPALASLHHGTSGEPSFLLGRGHRNCLDVSPHGRFIACGGYGNLAGGMDFWDRNKGKKVPRRVGVPDAGGGDGGGSYVTIKESNDLSVTSASPVVGHAWAPDSRTYLVSTTSPRMNVDNGARLYRYDGSLVDEDDLPWDNARYKPDKLLSAAYVPAPLPPDGEFHRYPDRPQSPPPRGLVELKGEAARVALGKLAISSAASSDGKGGGSGGTTAAPAAAAYVPPAARRGAAGGGAYVPPGARKGSGGGGGAGGGGSLAERMRREREGGAANVSGVKVTKRTGPVGAASVGGAAGAAGEKSKSAARREKQRLAKERAEREAAEAEERRKEEERARSEANKSDPEKRAKKIKKTLKQIEDIKAKAAGGAEVNEDQRKKLAMEEELRKELASLGL
ncbi:hypothetical protein ACHAWF_005352 [Thalassiosira exigua]